MASRRNFDDLPFSDAVIGNVLTRTAAPQYSVAKSNSHTDNADRTTQEQRPIHFSSASTVILPPLRRVSQLAGYTRSSAEQVGSFEQRSVPRRQDDAVRESSAPAFSVSRCTETSSRHAQPQATESPAQSVSSAVATLSITQARGPVAMQKRKRRVSLKSEACREQCRTNQARYRQKQREYVSTLKTTVTELRGEIPLLEVQRRRLRYNSQQRVWDVVVEYFQLFRHGVSNAYAQGSAESNDVLRASESQHQVMFLRSTMAPDVDFGNVCGVEVLMEHWRRLSEYHEDLHLRLVGMDKISETIVTATAMLSVTISKATLEYVFPRLMSSENVDDLSLAVKLLGHKLDYPCSVRFFWDEETNLIIRMETDVDVVTPLLKLLGNFTDVTSVLEGAVMALNGYIDEPYCR